MTCPHCGSGFDSKDKEAITYCSDFCHDKVFIPRTSLPKLPEGWKLPVKVAVEHDDVYELQDADGYVMADVSNEETATFLANLLNACYPNQENDR